MGFPLLYRTVDKAHSREGIFHFSDIFVDACSPVSHIPEEVADELGLVLSYTNRYEIDTEGQTTWHFKRTSSL